MSKHIPLVAVLLLATPCFASTPVETVYRTVENGVTSFSDSPPVHGTADVLTFAVSPPRDDAALSTRLAEMRSTTDRMAADRREREQQRDQRRRDRQERQAIAIAQSNPQAAYPDPWGPPLAGNWSQPGWGVAGALPVYPGYAGSWRRSALRSRGHRGPLYRNHRQRQADGYASRGWSIKYPAAGSPHRWAYPAPWRQGPSGLAQRQAGWSVMRPGNAQLMRPIVSSR